MCETSGHHYPIFIKYMYIFTTTFMKIHWNHVESQSFFFILEFWEDHFKCRYRGDRALNTPYNQDYKRNCSGNEKLTKENTQFEAQLQFVSDAVMAFAHAFRYN